jgi:hypothetical protein
MLYSDLSTLQLIAITPLSRKWTLTHHCCTFQPLVGVQVIDYIGLVLKHKEALGVGTEGFFILCS